MILFVVVLVNLFGYVTPIPFVEIPQGPINGQFLKTDNGRTFSSFTGIPYAEPPVGNLRFEVR